MAYIKIVNSIWKIQCEGVWKDLMGVANDVGPTKNPKSEYMNPFCRDIQKFHEKFGLDYDGPPRLLVKEESDLAIKLLLEEVDEYRNSVISNDLEGQFDALVDIVYVALGRAYRQGLPFERGWRLVQAANMLKMRATDTKVSKRGSSFDIIKPVWWEAPRLDKLLVAKKRVQKTRLIILEGPDCCGKTTLGKEIVRQLPNGVYWHMTRTKNLSGVAQVDYQRKTFQNILENIREGKSVIVDRCWISEILYNIALDRDLRMSDEMLKVGAEVCAAVEPYFIFCLDRNIEKATTRYCENVDKAHPYNADQYRAIYNQYIDYACEATSTYRENFAVRLFDDSIDHAQRVSNYASELLEYLSL